MLDDGCENVVGTLRVADEEPKVPRLVVHSKGVATEREIEPHLSHIVRKELRDGRTGKSLDMPTEIVPRANLGKLGELPGTVVHPKVEESGLHGRCAESPNDPKLSDGGAWRGSCEGGAKKEAADVRQRWLGVKTPKLEIAATVTRGAVRCSAWLGVSVIWIETSNNPPGNDSFAHFGEFVALCLRVAPNLDNPFGFAEQ